MKLPMKRYHRWNRLIIAVLSLFAFSSQADGSDLQPNELSTNISQIDANEYDRCVSNLHLADANDDLRLGREEYLYYILLQSVGSLLYEAYTDLPLSLLSNYVFTACMCSQTQGPECCVGDNIGITLDEEGEVFISDTIFTFCFSVDMAIQGLLPPSPSPTLAPSQAPTQAPTVSPTQAPTKSLSSSPTTAPTKSPTEQPTSTPTAAPSNLTSPSLGKNYRL
jgi:cell division septation protein DedD